MVHGPRDGSGVSHHVDYARVFHSLSPHVPANTPHTSLLCSAVGGQVVLAHTTTQGGTRDVFFLLACQAERKERKKER